MAIKARSVSLREFFASEFDVSRQRSLLPPLRPPGFHFTSGNLLRPQIMFSNSFMSPTFNQIAGLCVSSLILSETLYRVFIWHLIGRENSCRVHESWCPMECQI